MILCNLPAACSTIRFPAGRTGGDSRDAGIRNNGKQLCYGQEYGARRSTVLQRSNADHIIQCIYIDRMAVRIEEHVVNLGT